MDLAEPQIADRRVALTSDDATQEQAATLDLYKLGTELADRISARRGTTNAFYLTVQSALIAVTSVLAPGLAQRSLPTVFIVAGAGLMLSAAWWLSLRGYRQLNEAKYAVLHTIEARLPVQLFTDEWALLQSPPTAQRFGYAELGRAERTIPVIFALLWPALAVAQVAAR